VKENIGVVLTETQAKIFADMNPAVSKVITFCPAAEHVLKQKNFRTIPASDPYGALSHAKAAVLIERDLKNCLPALIEFYRLSKGEGRNLSVYLYHFLAIAYYVYFVTRAFNSSRYEFIWVRRKYLSRGDYQAMYEAVVAEGDERITGYANIKFSIAHYWLTALANRLIAIALKFGGRSVVMDFGDELPKKITSAMLAESDKITIVASKKVSKNMLRSFRIMIKSMITALKKPRPGKPVWVFRTANPGKYRAASTPAPVFKLTYAPVSMAARKAISHYIPFLHTEYEIGQKLVDLYRPLIAVSDFAKYPYVLAAQERMQSYGGIVAMMNHGTHTVQFDPISKIAAHSWAAQDRMITDFVTDHLPKSPLTKMIADEIRPAGYNSHKVNIYRDIETHPKPEDEFMVLHAGNYTSMFYHIPWVKETSEEYLLGMYEMIDAMKEISGTKLIIKLKAKKSDTHIKLVQDYIDEAGVGEKVVIDTSTPFSELLAKTSLVVSNISGTVEEALINHIPVMVHTYRKQYFHIPAGVLKPTGVNPAYLATGRRSIKAIFEFVRANRAELFNAPLYEKVAWKKEEVKPLRTFAAQIIARAGL
jgi:hypothetical protein